MGVNLRHTQTCRIISTIGIKVPPNTHNIIPSPLLSVQCYAWTEYKFTCVCVSVTLSVNSPTGQTPQRIFTVDSLKDVDLCKYVPFGDLNDE